MGLEEKCDMVLDMDAQDFAEQLREALGVQRGDRIHVTTPQFDRADGLQVPKPLIDFAKLPSLAEETLKQIGCQKWDEPDSHGNVLWLYPAEWYDHIPNGTLVVDISGETEAFKRGETDDDRRCGALAYGFLRKIEA
jgi:hypothetical protein